MRRRGLTPRNIFTWPSRVNLSTSGDTSRTLPSKSPICGTVTTAFADLDVFQVRFDDFGVKLDLAVLDDAEHRFLPLSRFVMAPIRAVRRLMMPSSGAVTSVLLRRQSSSRRCASTCPLSATAAGLESVACSDELRLRRYGRALSR